MVRLHQRDSISRRSSKLTLQTQPARDNSEELVESEATHRQTTPLPRCAGVFIWRPSLQFGGRDTEQGSTEQVCRYTAPSTLLRLEKSGELTLHLHLWSTRLGEAVGGGLHSSPLLSRGALVSLHPHSAVTQWEAATLPWTISGSKKAQGGDRLNTPTQRWEVVPFGALLSSRLRETLKFYSNHLQQRNVGPYFTFARMVSARPSRKQGGTHPLTLAL